MAMPTFIDLNIVQLNYYPFIISLDNCNGGFNVFDLLTKIWVPSKTKDVNVKLFNILTRRNGTKTLVAHISCDCKCKINS